ncbi:uncharacterized protein [Euwallacea fornicatus]|uniref:uncharacterized protein isoform X2 n=1 Tax=Euwallacea fornicatus TaxID=995702 RepID=UPI00338EA3C4
MYNPALKVGNYLYMQRVRLGSCYSDQTRRFSDGRPMGFGIDKMDMKKLIMDFRQFQRDRQKAKLVKKKMSSFNVVKFQRGAVEMADVIVKVHQGVAIIFKDENGEGFFSLEDTDITAFDNGESDDEDEHTLIVELYIYHGQQTVSLQFASLVEKQNFVAVLETFLQFRNRITLGFSEERNLKDLGK